MPATRPNILLISTDQQRFDTCGPDAPSFMQTPHIDQLCREGIRFSRAYADCPVCVPARMAIMSGRYVYAHGMPNNGPSGQVLGRDDTLPGRLRELGYQTAAVGKMHFGPQRLRHGFEEMILPDDYFREMTRSGNPLQPMRHGLGQCELNPTLSTVPESMTLTSWIAEQCVGYIRDRRDPSVPFFLWCSFTKPHPPFDPPEPYYSMYRDAAIPEPVQGGWAEGEACPPRFRRAREGHSFDLLSPEILQQARAAYLGLITQIDFNIGRLFAALKDRKLFDDTLILFTSDHGELLGDFHAGGKGDFLEGSAHVPFVLRPPRSWDVPVGDPNPALATHADILPTLVAAAGGETGEDVDGQDLFAVARGEVAPRTHLAAMCGSCGALYHNSITDGQWKYTFYHEGARELLFDLERDPGETVDRSANPDCAAKKRELREALVAFLRERDARPANGLQDAFGWYITDRERAIDAFLEDGDLCPVELRGDTTRERRSRKFGGYHTEYVHQDTRH